MAGTLGGMGMIRSEYFATEYGQGLNIRQVVLADAVYKILRLESTKEGERTLQITFNQPWYKFLFCESVLETRVAALRVLRER